MNKKSDIYQAGIAKEEDSLIARIKIKDKEAFRCVYEKYSPKIYGLALRMTGNTHLAEDLTQEIFLRIWNKIHLFNGKSSFSTWSTRLALNVILSHMRKKKGKNEIDITALTEFAVAEAVYDRESVLDLETAIAKLPAKTKLILILHDMQGYKHSEIGKMTKISEGTSKALLHRARKFLRKELLP